VFFEIEIPPASIFRLFLLIVSRALPHQVFIPITPVLRSSPASLIAGRVDRILSVCNIVPQSGFSMFLPFQRLVPLMRIIPLSLWHGPDLRRREGEPERLILQLVRFWTECLCGFHVDGRWPPPVSGPIRSSLCSIWFFARLQPEGAYSTSSLLVFRVEYLVVFSVRLSWSIALRRRPAWVQPIRMIGPFSFFRGSLSSNPNRFVHLLFFRGTLFYEGLICSCLSVFPGFQKLLLCSPGAEPGWSHWYCSASLVSSFFLGFSTAWCCFPPFPILL